ncbi:MAG: glycogen/starch/alpha-glucan phosphorylase [Collinsella sp.]
MADVINNDPRVNEVMKVCFIPNFRVSNASSSTAAEISEQISTAGKEDSGTSNMKLMMNGATLRWVPSTAPTSRSPTWPVARTKTIFGLTAPEVEQLWASNSYFAWDTLNNDRERLGRVMDELKDNTFAGLSGNFESIYNELMNNNDPDLVMADFRSYVDAWEKLTNSYGDQETWNRKALLNTASSGWFSSDRTIREYRDEIWHA